LIRDTSHILTTEAIAQLFERNSKNIHFIKEFCGVTSKEIEKIKNKIEENLRCEKLVFSRWSQVMFHFEKSLYEDPEQNLNNLWWELVNKYQLINFCRDKADWASKIHLVSSPVYYHNYILGELFASQINHYISKNILNKEYLKDMNYSGKMEIGNYLKTKIFFPGATYKWNELIIHSTDEELNPKYWIEEFS
jgi:peptidyl-dipeptidase A